MEAHILYKAESRHMEKVAALAVCVRGPYQLSRSRRRRRAPHFRPSSRNDPNDYMVVQLAQDGRVGVQSVKNHERRMNSQRIVGARTLRAEFLPIGA